MEEESKFVPLKEEDPMYGPPVSRVARLFPSMLLRTCSVRRWDVAETMLNFVSFSGAVADRV